MSALPAYYVRYEVLASGRGDENSGSMYTCLKWFGRMINDKK